jgi:hypothetical protein
MNRWLAFLVAIGTGLACIDSEVRAADPPSEERPAPTSAEIRGWVDSLASNRFEVREAATKKLERAGSAAVKPLSEAAQGESLEVTCRAIRALEGIADHSDHLTFEAAQTVLEQLAESPNRSVARRSEVALRGLANARRRHAMARINELGGIVKPLSTPRGVLIPNDEEIGTIQVILNKHWKGGDEGLIHLRRIDGLQGLIVTKGTPVTRAALDSLERDLSFKIQDRGPAMLGVMCGNQGAECVINRVAPGTAAEKAGLAEGDTIVKYDGDEVPTFERLIEITGNHNPGDRITLEIIRDGKPMKIEAVLTEWK